jgi:hypothetical protein
MGGYVAAFAIVSRKCKSIGFIELARADSAERKLNRARAVKAVKQNILVS